MAAKSGRVKASGDFEKILDVTHGSHPIGLDVRREGKRQIIISIRLKNPTPGNLWTLRTIASKLHNGNPYSAKYSLPWGQVAFPRPTPHRTSAMLIKIKPGLSKAFMEAWNAREERKAAREIGGTLHEERFAGITAAGAIAFHNPDSFSRRRR